MKLKKIDNYLEFKIDKENNRVYGFEPLPIKYINFVIPKTLFELKETLKRAYLMGRQDADRDWKTHAEKVMQHWGL